MLHRINPANKFPQCVCLAPTFELARQIGEVASKMAQYMPEVRIRYATKGERGKESSLIFRQFHS